MVKLSDRFQFELMVSKAKVCEVVPNRIVERDMAYAIDPNGFAYFDVGGSRWKPDCMVYCHPDRVEEVTAYVDRIREWR